MKKATKYLLLMFLTLSSYTAIGSHYVDYNLLTELFEIVVPDEGIRIYKITKDFLTDGEEFGAFCLSLVTGNTGKVYQEHMGLLYHTGVVISCKTDGYDTFYACQKLKTGTNTCSKYYNFEDAKNNIADVVQRNTNCRHHFMESFYSVKIEDIEHFTNNIYNKEYHLQYNNCQHFVDALIRYAGDLSLERSLIFGNVEKCTLQ